MPTIPLQVLRREAKVAVEQDARLQEAAVVFVDAGFYNDQITIAYARPLQPLELAVLPRASSTLSEYGELRRQIADAVNFMIRL